MMNAQATDSDPPVRLEVVCMGEGAANKQTSSTVQIHSNGAYATGHIQSMRSQDFADQVNVWVQKDDGRIRMPRTMLPIVRGGENGWFQLKNIQQTDREITASIAVNPLNNPKLRIDRYTGIISINGKAGTFTGRCQKFDPSNEQRAF